MNGLKMPAILAGLQIQRHGRSDEEIVAGANFAAELGDGVADAEIDHIKSRIDDGARPHASAADPPGVVVLGPGFVPAFARSGDRVELPKLSAGFRVQSHDASARSRFQLAAEK